MGRFFVLCVWDCSLQSVVRIKYDNSIQQESNKCIICLKKKNQPTSSFNGTKKPPLRALILPVFILQMRNSKLLRRAESHSRPFLLTLHPVLLHLFHCGADHVCPRASRRHSECRADVPCLSCDAAGCMRMANVWSLPSLERMWSGVVGRAVCLHRGGQI